MYAAPFGFFFVLLVKTPFSPSAKCRSWIPFLFPPFRCCVDPFYKLAASLFMARRDNLPRISPFFSVRALRTSFISIESLPFVVACSFPPRNPFPGKLGYLPATRTPFEREECPLRHMSLSVLPLSHRFPDGLTPSLSPSQVKLRAFSGSHRRSFPLSLLDAGFSQKLCRWFLTCPFPPSFFWDSA